MQDGSNFLKVAVVDAEAATTPQQLPSIACHEVTIIAKKTNAGSVYIGGPDVSTTQGLELEASDSFTFTIDNVGLLWLYAETQGEGVTYVAL